MEYKLTPVPADKAKTILGDIPAGQLGRQTPPEIVKLRESLANLKAGVVVHVDKGDAVQYDLTEIKGNERVKTGKKGIKYPVLVIYQTSVKYVNDNTKDGSKTFFFSDRTGKKYLVKVSAADIGDKKYHTGDDKESRFSLTKWRKANS